MINGLEGIPGSGKSYEAVAYHVLPALQAGRKVITNLPLNVDAFAAIDPAYRDLIELRQTAAPIRGEWDASDIANKPAFRLFEDGRIEPPIKTSLQKTKIGTFEKVSEKLNPFAGVWCYYSDWKNEEGLGPLFVVDECHNALENLDTSREVVEWYKIHRHYNADVLLITQSFRDINQPIARLIATLIRCRKADVLGNKDEYIRKVHAGYRGGLIQTDIRKYEPQYFSLYKSNTQGKGGIEAGLQDVNPFLKKFNLFKNAFLVCGAIYIAYAIYSLFWADDKKTPKNNAQKDTVAQNGLVALPDGYTPIAPPKNQHQLQAQSESVAQNKPQPSSQPLRQVEAMPQRDLGILGTYRAHMTGSMVYSGRAIATLAISDGARVLFHTNTAKLEKAGYTYQHIAHCAGWLEFDGQKISVLCDAPVQDGGRDTPIVMNPADGTRSDMLY